MNLNLTHALERFRHSKLENIEAINNLVEANVKIILQFETYNNYFIFQLGNKK